MKGLARMYVWWSGIAKDIEQTVQLCSACQMHQSTPAVAPLHPWSWPLGLGLAYTSIMPALCKGK